jgi:hypothetical protein
MGYECQECKECERLWKEYGEAMAAYIKLDNKLRFSALQDDHPLIRSLTLEVEQADKVRRAAREAIHRHERTHVASAV